jgi:hypothetical protein
MGPGRSLRSCQRLSSEWGPGDHRKEHQLEGQQGFLLFVFILSSAWGLASFKIMLTASYSVIQSFSLPISMLTLSSENESLILGNLSTIQF